MRRVTTHTCFVLLHDDIYVLYDTHKKAQESAEQDSRQSEIISARPRPRFRHDFAAISPLTSEARTVCGLTGTTASPNMGRAAIFTCCGKRSTSASAAADRGGSETTQMGISTLSLPGASEEDEVYSGWVIVIVIAYWRQDHVSSGFSRKQAVRK
jgi:hypothetical protein